MGALDAEMDDPEVLAPRRGQRGLADRLIDAAAAQVADRADRAQRDVHRIPRVEERPLLVRRTSPRALGRTTGAAALAAARLEQHQLRRFRAPRTSTAGCGVHERHASCIVAEFGSVNRFRRYFGRSQPGTQLDPIAQPRRDATELGRSGAAHRAPHDRRQPLLADGPPPDRGAGSRDQPLPAALTVRRAAAPVLQERKISAVARPHLELAGRRAPQRISTSIQVRVPVQPYRTSADRPSQDPCFEAAGRASAGFAVARARNSRTSAPQTSKPRVQNPPWPSCAVAPYGG